MDGTNSSHASEVESSASLLVSCTTCGKLHEPERPLESNPVCPPCTGRHAPTPGRMRGAHPLTAPKIDEEGAGVGGRCPVHDGGWR
jgi:hypothetical protein